MTAAPSASSSPSAAPVAGGRMAGGRDVALARVAPLLFVFLWSTGYVGARYGLPYAPPFTLLAARMALSGLLLAGLGRLTRTPFPSGTALRRSAITGVLLHGGYLGGVFLGIHLGVPAGLSAVIVNLQPVVTSVLAGRLLGEHVNGRQWLGLALGFGGVSLAVGEKLWAAGGEPISGWGVVASLVALAASTAGTIHHKRHGDGIALLTGTSVQYATAFVCFAVVAVSFERGEQIRWTHQLFFALAWMVLVLSLGAILLLLWLIRRTGASSVSSLLYLVPPLTALEAYLLFDERFGPLAILGAALAVVGVALVLRSAPSSRATTATTTATATATAPAATAPSPAPPPGDGPGPASR